jgi:menaquinone-dependent protoporphyrinogen oxidase
MASSILLAYATSSGSTLEVAQAISETLGGTGLEIEVKDAKQVKALSGYRAVLLGVPL